jgi:hypothetical protein
MLAVGAAGLLAALVITGGGFALMSTLPPPTRGDRLGARALVSLRHLRVVRTSIHLNGLRPFRATCLPSGKHELIVVPGRGLLVTGPSVRTIFGSHQSPRLVAAEADLAACPGLVNAELASQLLRGIVVLTLTRRWHGHLVNTLRISRGHPIVQLYLSPRLVPVGVTFSSRFVSGWSVVQCSAARLEVGCGLRVKVGPPRLPVGVFSPFH